jgi:hypothetical protein
MPKLRRNFRRVRLYETGTPRQYKAKLWYTLLDNDDADERVAEISFQTGDSMSTISDAMYHLQMILGQSEGTLDFNLMSEVPDEDAARIAAMPEGIEKIRAIRAVETETYWEASTVI